MITGMDVIKLLFAINGFLVCLFIAIIGIIITIKMFIRIFKKILEKQ